MKIYTRTGDDGTTALFGGDRVTKFHPRIEAYGTVDEASAAIGLAIAFLEEQSGLERVTEILLRVQDELFVLGGDLATEATTRYPVPRVAPSHTQAIEQDIDRMEDELPPLKHFILPGGTRAAAALHVARTICRRAERLTVQAATEASLNQECVRYLNRLSDLLFVLARWVNQQSGRPETIWQPVKR